MVGDAVVGDAVAGDAVAGDAVVGDARCDALDLHQRPLDVVIVGRELRD